MINQPTQLEIELTHKMLHELGIPVHRMGYKLLCEAIPLYAQNDLQSVTKEIYPALSKRFHASGPAVVERAIRTTITSSWDQRDPCVWEQRFPRYEKAPSNKVFISTLAEYIK